MPFEFYSAVCEVEDQGPALICGVDRFPADVDAMQSVKSLLVEVPDKPTTIVQNFSGAQGIVRASDAGLALLKKEVSQTGFTPLMHTTLPKKTECALRHSEHALMPLFFSPTEVLHMVQECRRRAIQVVTASVILWPGSAVRMVGEYKLADDEVVYPPMQELEETVVLEHDDLKQLVTSVFLEELQIVARNYDARMKT